METDECSVSTQQNAGCGEFWFPGSPTDQGSFSLQRES